MTIIHRAGTEGALFTETVDARTGQVRAHGHLGASPADLLAGTVHTLHRRGHDRILLDLRGVQTADHPGLCAVRELQTEMLAAGGHLSLIYPAHLTAAKRTGAGPPLPST